MPHTAMKCSAKFSSFVEKSYQAPSSHKASPGAVARTAPPGPLQPYHRKDAGVPAYFPFQLHVLSRCKGSRHALGCSSSLSGAVQFSGGSAGCTLSSDLEAREVRVLEAEIHLGAVKEQQVPAFLVKKKAKTT